VRVSHAGDRRRDGVHWRLTAILRLTAGDIYSIIVTIPVPVSILFSHSELRGRGRGREVKDNVGLPCRVRGWLDDQPLPSILFILNVSCRGKPAVRGGRGGSVGV
jgi:hypothetical protein